jgi:hypothetical protein
MQKIMTGFEKHQTRGTSNLTTHTKYSDCKFAILKAHEIYSDFGFGGPESIPTQLENKINFTILNLGGFLDRALFLSQCSSIT